MIIITYPKDKGSCNLTNSMTNEMTGRRKQFTLKNNIDEHHDYEKKHYIQPLLLKRTNPISMPTSSIKMFMHSLHRDLMNKDYDPLTIKSIFTKANRRFRLNMTREISNCSFDKITPRSEILELCSRNEMDGDEPWMRNGLHQVLKNVFAEVVWLNCPHIFCNILSFGFVRYVIAPKLWWLLCLCFDFVSHMVIDFDMVLQFAFYVYLRWSFTCEFFFDWIRHSQLFDLCIFLNVFILYVHLVFHLDLLWVWFNFLFKYLHSMLIYCRRLMLFSMPFAIISIWRLYWICGI